MKKAFTILALGLIIFGLSSFLPYPGGAPSPYNYSGSPSDGRDCSYCHGNMTTATGWITSNIPVSGYVPGTTYQITATNTISGSGKYGFEVSPQSVSGTLLGTLTAGTNSKVVGSGKWITQSTASSGVSSWTFSWTAPAAGTGTVTFYGSFARSTGSAVKNSTLVVAEGAQTLPADAGPVTGDNPVCQGSTHNYSVGTIAGATGYVWSVPSGASITSGQNTVSVTVHFSNTAVSGNISVYGTNGAGNGGASNLAVTVNPLPAAPSDITGPGTVCHNGSAEYNVTNVSGITYTWSVPAGASITAGQGSNAIAVTFGTQSGNIQVTPSNGCGNGSASAKEVVVTADPVMPDYIEGPAQPCIESEQHYAGLQKPGETYTWTVPAGSDILSGQGTHQIAVLVGATEGDISVVASNNCGTSNAQTLAIIPQSAPAQPGEMTGTTNPCEGSLQEYSVPEVAGLEYIWTVPSGYEIISGQGSHTVVIRIGHNAGNLSVTAHNACGTSDAGVIEIIPVLLPGKPGVIHGPLNIDLENVVTSEYTTEGGSNATSYEWNISPEDAGIIAGNTTSSQVTWNQSFSGVALIKVRGINTCGFGDWSQICEVHVTSPEAIHFEREATMIVPNPNNGDFKIDLKGIKGNVKLSIMDLTGKVVYTNTLQGETEHWISSSLPGGVYFIVLEMKDEIQSLKLIIRK